MKVMNIALLGFGTVGTGVYNSIKMNSEKIKKELGLEINIKKILVSNTSKKREFEDSSLFTDNLDEIINDDEINIVVEVMGGIDFAKKAILSAFEKRKHVVSANKDLIAVNAKLLYEKAFENNCFFMYEASVCGGIPIIRIINNHLFSEKISEVMGIVNGTTNFILTKMYQKYGLTYETVLSEAKELGYAEADPTADVEGYDAARKIAILSSLCFDTYVGFDDVYVEGITKITPEDVKYAKKFGYNIKLLGISKEHEYGIQAHVYPAFIPHSYQISKVSDAYNAVYLKSNALGSSMYYGKGAGSLPTASAVLSDIVNIIRNINQDIKVEKIDRNFKIKNILSIDEISTKYYIRLSIKSGENIISKITSVFDKLSIKTVEMLVENIEQDLYTVVIITEKTKEIKFKQCIEQIKSIDNNLKIENIIRIED